MICCETFKRMCGMFRWMTVADNPESDMLMPHVEDQMCGTKWRIQYCPFCGTECRSVEVGQDVLRTSLLEHVDE